MSMRRSALRAVSLALVLGAGAALAETPNLGRPISEADIAAWDISILPNGQGLPAGGGTAAQGKTVYAEQCAACHGENGRGGILGSVVGSPPIDRIDAVKTIANFWGYPTTVFDFIRRAMPATQPRTLSPDQVYALVAYIFAENKLIGEADVMNAETLPKVKMPNRDNFIIRFPDRI
ncbi:MAG TPA: cytochrome c [Xanthobacteraceae bacterium]|nr:cytochrome c [Xanthobacteraceae bacterium]